MPDMSKTTSVNTKNAAIASTLRPISLSMEVSICTAPRFVCMEGVSAVADICCETRMKIPLMRCHEIPKPLVKDEKLRLCPRQAS